MKKPKVFLVEDDQFFSLMLDFKFRDLALCQFDIMESGEECLKKLYLQPDVIVLDYGLPGINGLETLIRIRESGLECPVIFLSRESEAEIAEKCIEAGASSFIVKDKTAANRVYEEIVQLLT